MKIDGALFAQKLEDVPAAAKQLEELGYDGAFTFEGPHDPFFPHVLAAGATERLELATAIAIAFARSPMLLANIGWDLNAYSKGRFILGLGSQIRPHIEKRFSMPWSKPAARMRELVLAVREIWRCWEEGGRLDFRGEFYTHTLMTPFFNPGPNPYGNPRIFVAGVGPKMTEVAGEVADGFFVHPFHPAESFEKTTLPALAAGAARAGRSPKDIEVAFQLMVVSGANDEEFEKARAAVTQQIAFYGSTPAYRVVLETHGWGELQPELNRLSKRGKWTEMGALVTDDILEAIAVVAPMNEIADKVRVRCAAHADRVSLTTLWLPDPAAWGEVTRALRDDHPGP